MRQKVKKLIKHPLIFGSGIIFASSFIVNILNYVFNLIMGRLLAVSEYGLLISLIALVSLLLILQTSLTTLFAKFASVYSARSDERSMTILLKSGIKINLIIALCFLFGLFILIYPISLFLHVNNFLLLTCIIFSVFFSILMSLPNGLLQGNLKFVSFSIISIIIPLIKISIGVVLVLLGFGIVGAAFGILLSTCLSFTVAFVYVYRKYNIFIKNKTEINFFPEFKRLSGPFLIASFTITILQVSDVIFARHFLSSVQAGQFAALSLMGKAIFYLTAPIYFVFFPLISHKHEKKESTSETLFLALGIILLSSGIFSFIYFVFPNIILEIFFPANAYKTLSSYLGPYSIFILIFSVCFLFYNYFLSIGKISIYKITLSISMFYILLIIFFHKSIIEFINVLILCSFLLFISLFVYYIKFTKER